MIEWKTYEADDRRQVCETPHGVASIRSENMDDAFAVAYMPEAYGYTVNGSPPMLQRTWQGTFTRSEEKAKAAALRGLLKEIEETTAAIRNELGDAS